MDLDESLRRRLYVSFITIGIFFPLVTFFFLQFFLVKSFAKANIYTDASHVTVAINHGWRSLAKGSQINSFRVVSLAVDKIRDSKLRDEAVKLLDSMEGSRMRVEGEGDFIRAVASVEKDGYILLLVNYDPKNENKELAPLTLTNLQNGSYTVTISTVGGAIVKNEGALVVNGVMKRTVFMAPGQITMIRLVRER